MIRQPIVTICGHVDHGKCVSGDTLIPLVDGTIITAKELFDNNYIPNEAKKIDDGIIQDISKKKQQVFSFDGKDIISQDISHIWKRSAEKLIEIKLSSGDIIKTTPEHPFLILKGLEKKWEKAEKLETGLYVAIPSSINFQNSDILQTIIKKIKLINNFVCFVNENSAIFQKLKKISISDIEKKLKLKNIRDSIEDKRFRIKDFFTLTAYFNFPDHEAYAAINSIKNSSEGQRTGHTSKAIKLPNLHELEKLGYILGCITGDGHISKTNITLNNNDKDIQENYQEYLKQVWDIDSKFKRAHTCDTITDCSGMTFVRFISEIIGIPKGNKSGIVFVPEIAKKNKEIFRGFFSGLLDTDGYVSHLNNSIEITSKSKKLLKECSILLLNFGIHSVVFQKNGFYTLRIANKKYLEKFLENFNPRLKRKLVRIIEASKKAESSRIFDFLPISGEFLKELKMPGKINKKIPYFSKYGQVSKISKWLIKSALESIKTENETSKKFRELLEQKIDYVQIVSKKEIKNDENYVYDFTIPNTSNFIAERVIVHNTSILDKIRGSSIAKGEAGGITQKISFTLFPAENIKKGCYLLDKYNIALQIPGLLFIDTPGHAAFTNLRKRGGSLADMAILVVDINKGIEPQTAEVLQILKANKTPFIIALNKIDNISGWQKQEKDLRQSIETQADIIRQSFDEKFFTFVGSLSSHGFESDLFYNITDFTKKIALVPCSARTGEGIPELMMTLCGLSQKFLSKELSLGEKAKGVILEIKKEKAQYWLEAILYDGKLKVGDEIAIASFGDPILAKIRSIDEILPISEAYKSKHEVVAASGLRLQLTEKKDILPGMPFVIYEGNMQEIEKEFKKEIENNIKTEKEGIVAKAESLGSLEALLTLLKEAHVPVSRAGIGNINKADITAAKTSFESTRENAVIVGFNSEIDEDAKEMQGKTKIVQNAVVYKLIEDLIKWREDTRKQVEKEKLSELANICKVEILHQYVFRNSNPAVFGVKILGGKIIAGIPLIARSGEGIGNIKALQMDGKSIGEAREGEIAISVTGVTFDRELKQEQFLYSDMSERQFKMFKKHKDLLTDDEKRVLMEIAEIKRKKVSSWGMVAE